MTKTTKAKAGTPNTKSGTAAPRRSKEAKAMAAKVEAMARTIEANPDVDATSFHEQNDAETERLAETIPMSDLMAKAAAAADLPVALAMTPDLQIVAKPAKAPKVLPTLDEALAIAKLENPGRYANVVEVTELTKDGSPKRVVILCGDPQSKQGVGGEQESVCELTREIAVQDLFQVQCCAACADRKVRKARRNRAKVRDKAARKALKAREQR